MRGKGVINISYTIQPPCRAFNIFDTGLSIYTQYRIFRIIEYLGFNHLKSFSKTQTEGHLLCAFYADISEVPCYNALHNTALSYTVQTDAVGRTL